MSFLGVELISFPDFCQPAKIPMTSAVAGRIYQILIAHGSANPCEKTGFMHMVSDVNLGGMGQNQFLIRNSYFGVCGYYRCGDEWYCVTTLEDWSDHTRQKINKVNLKLAELRDTIMLELYP